MQPRRGPWSIVQEICNKTFAHSYSGIQSIESDQSNARSLVQECLVVAGLMCYL